jgi:hypothetical protein
MKFRGFIAILVSAFLFYSCDKGNNAVNSQNGPTTGVITATINGYAWGALNGYSQKDASGALILYGENNSSNNITIKIYPYNGPGKTYTVDGMTKIIYNENNKEYTSLKGSISVTSETDKSIQGNFTCEVISSQGAESLVFNNGQFNIPKY